MSLTAPAISGLITVNYVTMSILNRLRNYSMRHYQYIAQLVIEGYGELALWHLDTIEVVYLRMSSAKVVDLPTDYVDYVKIGIPVNGKLKVLTHKPNILLPRTFADGAPVGNTDDSGDAGSIFFVDHFRSGQFVAGLYGLPGGLDNAYYRIDRENRQIVFSGSIPRSEVVLEYVSSGIKLSGQTNIPRETLPSLRAYVLWHMIDMDPKVPMGEKERRKNNYLEEVAALDYFQSAFTADEYKRHVWKSTRQTIKR